MKILTLNLWGNYGPFEERFEFFLEELACLAPDLLFLQEIKDNLFVQTIKQTLGIENVLFDYESGLATFSRFPFFKTQILKYKSASSAETDPRKALITEIAHSSGKKITLANTHLSWRVEDEPIRLGQVNELLNHLNSREISVLLAGDFNDTPESKPIMRIKNAAYQDLLGLLHPGESNITWDNQNPFIKTHSVTFPDRQIDFLFANQNFLQAHLPKNCEVAFNSPNVKEIYASDHYGIFARI